MIRDYTDNAANERTFLAWVRTGIAVVALGIVIERINLYFQVAVAPRAGEIGAAAYQHLASPGGRNGGPALVFVGVAIIGLATARFLHTSLLLADDRPHSAGATRVSLTLLCALIFVVAGFAAYLGMA